MSQEQVKDKDRQLSVNKKQISDLLGANQI